jgi:hypothetical protein
MSRCKLNFCELRAMIRYARQGFLLSDDSLPHSFGKLRWLRVSATMGGRLARFTFDLID